MREIMFDVETTGLFHDQGDRIIEIGAVEVVNFMPTGETFQAYIDPGRSVSKETIEITGITDDMLHGKPKFEEPEIVDKLLAFFGDARIVAHNAKFDHGFLNMELKRCGYDPIPYDRWLDSAAMARSKFPGSPVSLDALCKRFNINSDARTFHGALLDSEILADVYLRMTGGQVAMDLAQQLKSAAQGDEQEGPIKQRDLPIIKASAEELEQHESRLDIVEESGGACLWRNSQQS